MFFSKVIDISDSFFSWLAPMLTTKEFSYTYCVVIILLVIRCILKAKSQYKKLSRSLQNAKNSLLEASPVENNEDSYPSEKERKEHSFYSNFDTINNTMLANPIFQHNWSEFCESLIFPTSSDDPEYIKNSHSAGYFFNENSILLPYYSKHTYAAWPNYFTGLGILGTFLGLAAGIFLANAGLSSSIGTANTEGLKLSLQNLLSGAGLAFATSIAGLFCSILFSMVEKGVYNSLVKELSELINELDACVRRITVEDIGRQQLYIQEKQCGLMQEFVERVGCNIENAINNMFTEGMQPLLREMVSLREERSTDSATMITEALATFTEQLHGSAGKEMAALGSSIGEMSSALLSLLEECKETQRSSMQSTQALINVADRLGELHVSIGQTIERMVNGAMAFEQISQNLREDLQQNAEHSTKTFEQIKEFYQKIQMSSEQQEKSFEQHLLVMQEQQRVFETTWTQSVEAIDLQRVNLSSVWEQFLLSCKEHYSDLNKYNSQIASSWEKYCERFEGVDTALVNTFREIDSGLNSYGKITKEYVVELDKHLAEASSHLNGVVRGLKETIEDWNALVEDWKELAKQAQVQSEEHSQPTA